MPNLKEVRNRISSTISTQQITKAMKLVSATKLRKATSAITQMRPYAIKLQEILANLSDSVDDDQLNAYFELRETEKVLFIAISSDRGLCGAFNANIGKKVKELIGGRFAKQYKAGNVTVLPVGKKAYENLKKDQQLKYDLSHIEIFQDLNAKNVFETGEQILNEYKSGDYDKVILIYNKFINAATQEVKAETLLPVTPETNENEAEGESSNNAKNDYIFEPSKVTILQELVPRSLKTQLYKATLDSFASEHGARMVAMDKATENAGELLQSLKVEYNKARQAAITNEISEIVGGAAALEG
jgi:F-type H+-transporting ATPase subunit gamma